MSRRFTFTLLTALAIACANPQPGSAGVDVWTSDGPEGGGFVTRINVSADGRQVWASSQLGVLFRSVNGGDAWSTMGRGIGTSVSEATPDPWRPGTVWVGTPTGAFRSDDYGLTFKSRNVGLINPAVYRVDFDPNDPDRLWATTSTRVFVSTDQGESWSGDANGPTGIRGLAADPAHPGRVWVISTSAAARVWRSDDGGATWAARDSGLPAAQPFGFALDPAHTDRAWVTFPFVGLYRTEDGGASWSKVATTLTNDDPIITLGAAPTTPTRLFVNTTEDVLFSDDLGATFTATACPLKEIQRLIVVDGEVWAVGGTGVFRRAVSGGPWEHLDNGLNRIAARSVAVGPDTGIRYLAAFPGFFRDAGNGWEDISASFPTEGGIDAIAAPGADEDAMMALLGFDGGSLYRTAGEGWESAGQGLASGPINDVAIDPAQPQERWVAQQADVYRSANGGDSWTKRSDGLPVGCCQVLQVEPDPRANGVAYAVTKRGGLFKTANDGGSWSLVDPGLDFDLLTVGIDPHHPDRIYAGGVNGNVYRSEDGGASWTAGGSLGAPVETLLADPRAGADILYGAAFGTGVFRSTDRGATWTPLAAGLEYGGVVEISADLDGSALTLYAATSGAGVFARTVSLGTLNAPVDFSSSPSQPQDGEEVHLDAIGVPAGAQVSWDFGDGTTANGPNPRHVFPGPGTWQVTMHAGLGAQATAKTRAVVIGEGGAGEPCVAGPKVLCVRQGRFKVTVDWHDFSGNAGQGTLVTQSSDSGLFWFFDDDNWELMVKVLDGCGLNGRFWIFSAATTNVEYTLRVTDTANGTEWSYRNPSGTAAPAITDTDAFDTCP